MTRKSTTTMMMMTMVMIAMEGNILKFYNRLVMLPADLTRTLTSKKDRTGNTPVTVQPCRERIAQLFFLDKNGNPCCVRFVL